MPKKQKPKIAAFMALRGGSKSIPRKNIRKLAGKPLCFWSSQAALNSKYIETFYVSTEDPEIKSVVQSFSPGIRVIDRPVELAADDTLLESIIFHAMDHMDDFDILITLQATSPLTEAGHVDAALEKFMQDGYDSMLTGVLMKRFYWTKDGRPLNYDFLKRPMRQEFEGSLMENGAFYITRKHILEKEQNRLGGRIGIFVMPDDTHLEVDEPADWEKMEQYLIKKHGTRT